MKALVFGGVFFVPALSYAAAPTTFKGLIDFLITTIINPVISILVGVAVIIFFWGIFKYITSAGEEGHEKGRSIMLWGALALFLMVSILGIINLLKRSLL